MTLSMYSASVPVFVRNLENLAGILAKGQAHANTQGVDDQVLVQAKLADDMHPLPRQVQIACDMAKFCVARLSGEQAPAFEDNETTFDQLQERIAKTIAFLKSVDAVKIEGTDSKDVHVSGKMGEFNFKGQDYLTSFVYPNFFFHMTTAYAILRNQGVSLGKLDFMGVKAEQKAA